MFLVDHLDLDDDEIICTDDIICWKEDSRHTLGYFVQLISDKSPHVLI